MQEQYTHRILHIMILFCMFIRHQNDFKIIVQIGNQCHKWLEGIMEVTRAVLYNKLTHNRAVWKTWPEDMPASIGTCFCKSRYCHGEQRPIFVKNIRQCLHTQCLSNPDRLLWEPPAKIPFTGSFWEERHTERENTGGDWLCHLWQCYFSPFFILLSVFFPLFHYWAI